MKKIYIVTICIVFFSCNSKNDLLFYDDFENDLSKWDLITPHKIQIINSKDPSHKNVLALYPGGPSVYALIKNSEKWNAVSIEGDLLFPSYYSHYLGFIYNYRINGQRADFGSIYIYGPYGGARKEMKKVFLRNKYYAKKIHIDSVGNIIRPNPHRDGNASRELYPEYYTWLEKDSAVKVNEWHHFKFEKIDSICHFYINNMQKPILTFDLYEYNSGKLGFKPRYEGSESWIDNISVKAINQFSYRGQPIPNINYERDSLINQWNVLGPLSFRIEEIETSRFNKAKTYISDNKEFRWNSFETDKRGCVLSGKLGEFQSGKKYIYFHTQIVSNKKKLVNLELDSGEYLLIWHNEGEYIGCFKGKNPNAPVWYDFWKNPEHAGESFEINLEEGKNDIIILSMGARYSGDGFFARWE